MRFNCVLLLVLALKLFNLAESCGIGVHVQILSRIRENLAPDVNAHSSFAIPGAFFPDAFYSCMSQSATAEIAHWPPFLKATAQYYRKKYDSGKNPAGVGLRAFLFGVLTHQIADVSWHSLGVDQGLLMAMAIREFDGDYVAAHNTLDTGGDVIIMERLLRTSPNLEWLIQRWSIPSKDIIEIYSSMGISVSRPVLEYCMARGVAALGAELNIARSMYPSYAKKSALLLDSLEDYFLGGLEEIRSSIIKCLHNLESWLDNGTPDDPWELCPVFSGRAPKRPHYREENSSYVSVGEALGSYIDDILPTLTTTVSQDGSTTYINFPSIDLPEQTVAHRSARHQAQTVMQPGKSILLMTRITESLFGSSFAIANFRGEAVGPCLAIGAPYETTEETGVPDGAVYVIPLSDLDSMFMASTGHAEIDLRSSDYRLFLPQLDGVNSAGLVSTNFTLPRQFGASIAALNLLNTTLLAVTSPGISTIDIYAGPAHLITLLPPSQGVTTAYGAKGRKLFGKDLHVHDIDRDGYPDLIVCAANSDLSSLIREQGEIMILSGREIEMAITQGSSSVAMDLVRLSRLIRPMHDQSTYLGSDFELFGSRIAFSVPPEESDTQSEEIAYIGAAGSGAVYAFDAVSGEPLFALFANLAAKRSSTGFGGGVLLTGRIKGLGEWVLIGSPNESLVDWKLEARNAPSDEHADNDINQQRRIATDKSQTGVCYLYLVRRRNGTTIVVPKLLAYLVAGTDGAQFGKFGYAGTKLNGASSEAAAQQNETNTVFLSSPFAESGAGAVWRIEIEDIILPMFNFDASGALEIDVDMEEQVAVPVIRLNSILQGSPINKQTESWFGKSIAAVTTDIVSPGNGPTGYLFVGMPFLGFGDMGTNTDTGQQLTGGVGVYSLS
ncbi:zinc dependent phospholipase C-domain-containing protein [Lipomyces kononenkoae]|uniref:Zinc dependent phospholipase C-domain-containing protein n=1 Tax=Lipomyces kononenkoae TaxID=34357 RepID=A0ACC3STN5_LIPKO